MSKDRRNPDRHGPPPGLNEEKHREWWRRRSKWVWGPGDIMITKKGERPKKDDEGASPGR